MTKNRKRLIVLGIDSLDSVLLNRFEPFLPNFKRLKEQMPTLKYSSVLPPDSITAWASIYTGCDPAKHGRVYFIAVDKVNEAIYNEIDNNDFHGKTFWDIASDAKKKVCVLFPHIGYPPWKVNGLMVSKAITKEEIRSYPESAIRGYDLSDVKRLRGVPTVFQRKRYIKDAQRLLLNEESFGLRIYEDYKPDLFFLYSSVLDFIEHNFWSLCDKDDPAYPGSNSYEEVIKKFYKLYDNMLGKFLKLLDSETTLMVLSDHGHGMRPVKLFNINEFLRREGALASKIKSTHFYDPYFAIEQLKHCLTFLIDKFSKYGLGNLAISVLHYFTAGRKLYKAPSYIDWDKTLAHLADLSGVKAYSYGGIVIRMDNLKQQNYEQIRTEIIEKLRNIKIPSSGKALFKLVCRREDLYKGKHISKFPDILFELSDEYGAGWSVNSSLFGRTYSHKLHAGTHKRDTGVFLISNPDKISKDLNEISCMDIAPTVLGLLDVKGDYSFDGRCIVED
ncbi:MAG: alkaline phosphatase family protein [Candidatus Omnitrophica bacterium]|nr:alkaline phosphatase family protein [Candidatus Omnitrophota bacterium]